jgi:hypothetical protein
VRSAAWWADAMVARKDAHWVDLSAGWMAVWTAGSSGGPQVVVRAAWRAALKAVAWADLTAGRLDSLAWRLALWSEP